MVATAASGITALGDGCGSDSNNGGTGGADGGALGGHGGASGHGGGVGGGAGDGGVVDARGSDATDGATDLPGTDARTDGSPADSPADVGPAAMLSFPFDTGLDGFDIDRIATSNPTNIGALSVDGGVVASADFDGAVGMPAAGSAHIAATFTDYNQLLALRRVYANTQTINLAGKTITAWIRLDGGADGGGATFSGVARLFALSSPTSVPGFFLAEGGSVILNDHAWHMMMFNVASPEFVDPRFNPADIVHVGVHLATPAPAAGDAAAPPFGAPQTISVHFDTVTSN